MANMSYCRFENTVRDLQDCLEAIRNGEADDHELSETELESKKDLIAVCKQIINEMEGEE